MTRNEHVLTFGVAVLAILLVGTLIRLVYLFNEIAVVNKLLRKQELQVETLNRLNVDLNSLMDMIRKSEGVQRLVPDTLNLADNALLGIFYLINCYGSELPYWSAHLLSPTPYLVPYEDGMANDAYLSGAEALRSMVLLRNMIGGELGKESEKAYKDLMLDYIKDVGLLNYVGTTGEGSLGTLINYYVESKDDQILDLIEQAVEDIKNDVVFHGSREGGYVTTHSLYGEGRLDCFAYIGDLMSWYEITGDETALNLAGNMSNYFLYHSNYVLEDGRFNFTTHEPEDGDRDWVRQIHKTTMATIGIVKWEIATGNREVIEWGKRIFDFVWSFSGGIGWIPERLEDDLGSETCAVKDIVLLAILLAENGYPKYWNLVERTARNQLVENQLQNTSWISRPAVVPEDTELRSYYNVADRVLGIWGCSAFPNDWVGSGGDADAALTAGCCLSGNEALYAVWHHIVTKNETGVYVNLNLNRDSKWVLVNSYVPYEGKVEILIHEAPTLYVRVPDWANRIQVNVTVDDSPAAFEWSGEYVKLEDLSLDQKVTVTYPQRELVEKVRVGANRRTYTLTWHGDTVVEIYPKGKVCPLYQREQYKQDKAPMKFVSYYIPEEEISFPCMSD